MGAWLSLSDGGLSWRDKWLSQSDGGLSWRDKWLSQRDGLLSQRDGWLSQKDGRISHIDGWLSHRDGWIRERRVAKLDRWIDSKVRESGGKVIETSCYIRDMDGKKAREIGG
jgi:hypothetical protein